MTLESNNGKNEHNKVYIFEQQKKNSTKLTKP